MCTSKHIKPSLHLIIAAALLFVALLQFAACKECDNGYSRKGGDCICPDGKYVVGDFCETLAEHQYYLDMTGCKFPDTLLIKILSLNDTIFGIPVVIWRLEAYKNGLTKNVGLQYIDLPSTDSLTTTDDISGFWDITRGDTTYQLYFDGRFTTDDKIKGTVTYRWDVDKTTVLGTCPVELVR